MAFFSRPLPLLPLWLPLLGRGICQFKWLAPKTPWPGGRGRGLKQGWTRLEASVLFCGPTRADLGQDSSEACHVYFFKTRRASSAALNPAKDAAFAQSFAIDTTVARWRQGLSTDLNSGLGGVNQQLPKALRKRKRERGKLSAREYAK